ncbi:MAG TPA: hypothetical protein EYF95_00905 [Flavobacteriales bacterium]|nr:hypothetical protein [Flavobacteriales bacterium]
MITPADYMLVESLSTEYYGVRLLTGPFAGVIVVYGTIKITEDVELGEAKLKFTYQTVDPGDNDQTELDANEDFMNHLGAVLECIIEDSLANEDENNENNGVQIH